VAWRTVAPSSQQVIVRNFQTRISRPSSPYRRCRKNTGPAELNLMRAAMIIIGTAAAANSAAPTTRSATRFAKPATP
jgi:hypothetical protein